MQSFEWINAASVDDAVKFLRPAGKVDPDEQPRPIGGGQDLLTTMKSYITRPPRVVNLKTIPNTGQITAGKDGLTIDALVTLTALAAHADVKQHYPGLVEAAHSIATPQIRNLGTVGGNLNQRPRCWYFRNENVTCLKKGGDTCYAIDGENKYHAIFTQDEPCVFTHPSDLAPMLWALGATLAIAGPAGTRQVPINQFFVMPKVDVRHETVLQPGEIVIAIKLPPTTAKSTYLKFKERASLDFAMASVAAVVDFNADKSIQSAHVVLGGVAPIPWALPAVDAFLIGKKLDDTTVKQAATLALDGAKPLQQNGYKVPLTKTLVRRALSNLTV